jgi:hypothetical protein
MRSVRLKLTKWPPLHAHWGASPPAQQERYLAQARACVEKIVTPRKSHRRGSFIVVLKALCSTTIVEYYQSANEDPGLRFESKRIVEKSVVNKGEEFLPGLRRMALFI